MPVPLANFLLCYHLDAPEIHPSVARHQNTRSHNFAYIDVGTVSSFPAFHLNTYLAHDGDFLASIQVDSTNAYISPQRGRGKTIRCEQQIVDLATRSIFTQVNRALAAASRGDRQVLMVDQTGKSVPQGSDADRIGTNYTTNDGEPRIQLVGDVKPSWNWKADWRHAPADTPEHVEYRQVLSQVHFYMNEKGTRYGYILTDSEFVALERDAQVYGNLMVSDVVTWDRRGCGGMTLAMALFAIHRMATSNWTAPILDRPDRNEEDDDEEPDSEGGAMAWTPRILGRWG
jgi:hypothetical protein